MISEFVKGQMSSDSIIKVRFYPCGSGEFIVLNLPQDHLIMIDSGYKRQYEVAVKPLLDKNDKLELLVMTHTDEDHVGGIVKLIESGAEKLLQEKIRQVWFNWSSIEYMIQDDKISVGQGMLLRDKLGELGMLHEADITTETPPSNIENSIINILSPSTSKLEKSKVKWKKEENKKISAYSDYHIPIEELLENEFVEDTSVWNGGSIAVLIESEGKRVLLLADSHPSVIIETLKSEKFGCTSANPIKVDCVKVSHHGSKANTNFELLELIDCTDWVFCANYTKHGFPHKECIARIIYHRRNDDQPTRLLFNHDRPTYDQVFGVDDNAMDRFNFKLIHLSRGNYEI